MLLFIHLSICPVIKLNNIFSISHSLQYFPFVYKWASVIIVLLLDRLQWLILTANKRKNVKLIMQKELFCCLYLPDSEHCLFWWPKVWLVNAKAVYINLIYELIQSQDKSSEECYTALRHKGVLILTWYVEFLMYSQMETTVSVSSTRKVREGLLSSYINKSHITS